MKRNIITLTVFLMTAMILLLSLLNLPSANTNGNQSVYPVPDTQFIIAAFHNGGDYSALNYQHYSQLKFNTWHHYAAPKTWGWKLDTNDKYNKPVTSYQQLVQGIISENASHDMRTFMDRPIVQYLVGGQRIDYKCEQAGSSFSEDPYWFYSYYNSNIITNNTDYSITDVSDVIHGKSETVKYCNKLNGSVIESDILINDSLKANREMSFNAVNPWMSDTAYEWYVMPRIKIDPEYAAGTLHDSTPVCRIVVTSWTGNIEKEFVLKAVNFKDQFGNYDGRYLQSFNLKGIDTADYLIIDSNLIRNFADPVDSNFTFEWNHICKCDIKIYWTGVCDMWIDRVRIENRPAHQFLTLNDQIWIDKLEHEIDWAATQNNVPNYFYFEEAAFSHFPCIAEINKRVRERSNIANEMVIWLNYDLFNVQMPFYDQHWMTAEQLYWYLNNEFGLNNIVMGSYALEGWPDGGGVSYHPNTLSEAEYSKEDMVLSYPISPQFYDNNLQDKLDYKIGGTGLIYVYSLMNRLAVTGMKVICCPQAHGWWGQYHRLKEPTNQELELQACLALAYNAKGIIYFCYNSFDDFIKDVYGRGIMNIDYSPRTESVYEQNKFQGLCDINTKLKKWGPHILNFNSGSTRTCIYRIDTSRSGFINNTYFREIKTELLNPYTQCANIVPGMSFETPSSTFMQATVFKNNAENFTKYFMLLNRRCTPGDDDCSGRRFVSIVLDSTNISDFSGFNNWKIIDLFNDSTIITFDKRISSTISLGKYKPAEGKLYKIIPVMIDGGTFVCDENVTATSFNCNGVVYTGGYDLLVPAAGGQTTINFHPDAFIQAENGENIEFGQYNNVILKAQNGGKWKGLYINNYYYTDFSNTTFENIGDANNIAYWSISMNDCPNVNINECNFSLPDKAKGINLNNYSLGDVSSNIVLTDNNISINDATAAVFIGCSANGVNDVLIFDNTITNGSQPSTYGILISNGYAPYIDGNTISGFNYGIELINTIAEMESNNINCYRNNTTGILAVSSSTINMGNIGDLVAGGNNVIINKGTDCKNVSLNNSVFEMNYGSNSFEVNNTQGNFNLTGNGNFHPGDDSPVLFIEVIGNCFNGEGYFARDSVTELNGTKDSLLELPHYCTIQQDMIVDFLVPVTSNITDTVYKSSIPECQNGTPAELLNKRFNKNLLKRNYDSTKILGLQILTNYTDSVFVPNIISQLYFAYTRLGNISTNMQAFKTFLEQLILNHSGNLSLVRSANYYIQKCKVHLHQYTSALEGYQDIIVQNPYSYEGLLASWDYAATLLLANSGGAYSYDNTENLNSLILESQFLVDSLRMNRLMRNDNYDSKSFSKEDRKTLIKSVGNVLKDEREKQIEKVKTLEEKLTKSDGKEKTSIKQNLDEMKNLNSLIKTKRPKDKAEYQAILNNDIEKLHPGKNTDAYSGNNIIPQTFELYQNYPNPFNPTTKISFDLPKDARVKLVIYDILGREMRTLINNEFRTAGKYISEFNGSQLASGVYFARILINDGKDFVAVKKMVLVK